MSQEAEEPEEKSEDYSLEEFDSTLQLGDTELNGVPYDEIIDNYSSEGVDQIVFHGDASKKEAVSEEDYFEQLKETYSDLDKLGEELDAEVLVLPGNHEPIKGSHKNGADAEYVENVERLLEDEYEEFSEYEGNAYEFLVESHDNLTDLTNKEYETEEGNTIIGMSDHFGPEIDSDKYNLMKLGDDIEHLDYDREEIANKISEVYGEENSEDDVEGRFKDFLNNPKVKWWLKPVGSGPVETGSEESVEELKDIDPEDITREHIENLPEEVREEVMTSKHENYLEALENGMDLTEEEKEEFKEQVTELGSRISKAEGKVHLVHHSTPFHPEENKFGSVVLKEAIEEYGDKIDIVSGGHSHGSGEYKLGDVHILNAAETYSEIGLGDQLHTKINEMDVEEPAREPHEPTEEEEEDFKKQVFKQIEERGVTPDEYYSHLKEQQKQRLDMAVEQGHIDEDEREQRWNRVNEALEEDREEIKELWESGEYEEYLEEEEA